VSNYDNDIEVGLAANVAVICTGKEVCDSNFLTLQDHSFTSILHEFSGNCQTQFNSFGKSLQHLFVTKLTMLQ
jgi:hypothetical protein